MCCSRALYLQVIIERMDGNKKRQSGQDSFDWIKGLRLKALKRARDEDVTDNTAIGATNFNEGRKQYCHL